MPDRYVGKYAVFDGWDLLALMTKAQEWLVQSGYSANKVTSEYNMLTGYSLYVRHYVLGD